MPSSSRDRFPLRGTSVIGLGVSVSIVSPIF
jgi:hypothetical protein